MRLFTDYSEVMRMKSRIDNAERVNKMRFGFRKHHHDEENERHMRMSAFSVFLMAVGFLTVLYLLVVYVIIPVLAAMTPRV